MTTATKHKFIASLVASVASSTVWQNYVNSGQAPNPRANNRGLTGPIENQLTEGSCTAFAATQFRVDQKVLAGYPRVELAENANYYEERVLNNSVSQDSGATMEQAVQVLEEWGGMAESVDPYGPQTEFVAPPSNAWDASYKLDPKNVFYITNLTDLKDALQRGMPVMIAYECFAELEGGVLASTGWLNMPADPSNSIGGHMTLAIGYDDELQAILVKNQWGTGWGIKNDPTLDGCFWMPYSYVEQYVRDIVAGLPDDGKPLQPQPVPTPFVKPEVIDYTVTIQVDKSLVIVGDVVTATVQTLKDGQPLPGQIVTIGFSDSTTDLADGGPQTDANGHSSLQWTATESTIGTVSALVHFLTPYGDEAYADTTFTVAAAPAPTPSPTPAPTPSPSPTPVLYHVQTGAFRVRLNAANQMAQVRASGFNAFINESADGLFHVQVGAFENHDNAIAMESRLQSAGFPAFITTE